MNILILANGAPNYHHFFNALSTKLKKDDHNIFYAVDCHTSADEYNLALTTFPYSVFSDFFAQHTTNISIFNKYKKYNLNAALLSDYERATEYKIWGVRDNDFYEKLKSALLCYFEQIISENKINAVIYENVSNSFAYFAWFVCMEHSVKYLGLTSSRLPGRFWITDDPLSEHKVFSETLNQITAGSIAIPPDIRHWTEQYIENIETITPDYMSFNNLENTKILNKYLKIDKLKKITCALRHIRDDHYHSYQRGNPLLFSLNLFLRSLGRRFKSTFLSAIYDTAKDNEDFILYPLHFHPESSTSVLCGTYLNELEVIQNIAFNLPQGLKLYVKDHMSAFGYPSMNFYKRIKSLPNVRILPPHAATKHLIKRSKAVITLTSTVGYEALLLNKPVYLFGSVFYENHKNVIKIENPRSLFEQLSNIPDLQQNTPEIKEYNIRFIAAYYMNTLSGVLNFSLDSNLSKELVEKIYPEILKKIN